ncbi:hypothetical protein [Psychromonas arctica]|uniref:hypothetical protein n=1 Tax=Psychromonas arctica TaxID=168275 RepID=UPI000428411C|nr:hypothetical protein [Psychromonas arctica]
MKKINHDILKLIHEQDEVGIRELCRMIKRTHNDHRDFYGLTALLKAGYINFTGPIPKVKGTTEINSYIMALTFQAYSQGTGEQSYKSLSLLASDNEDAYLFIGEKGIEYFHSRSENRKGWYLVAVLTLVCSIISGVIVAKFNVVSQRTPYECCAKST